ncbi:MAG: hypothetical protein ABW221_27985, partial [Vicinamibacteria bacterium]
MLAVTRYPQEYVKACRKRVDEQLAAYAALAKAAPAEAAWFEPLFCSTLVLALEASFVHRTRGMEGKDGNPLNEVRMLCTSILQNDGHLAADKTVKYDPAKSVLKLPVGAQIELKAADVKRLAKAFFDEIGR